MNCIICGENNYDIISKRVRDSDRFKVVRCKGCGLLQLYPRTSIDEDKKFYDQDCQSKNIGMPNSLKLMKENSSYDTCRRANLVSKYISRNHKILDIGSGYGFFLKEMHERGYNITGIEISKERRKISSRVSNVNVLDVNLYDNKNLPIFDCVTLFHVLEHISDPIHFLKVIKKYLSSNGKLIIEVPNVEDMLIEECKEYKSFYWQRAHMFYFSAKTLRKLLEKSDFLTIDVSYVQRYSLENFMNWRIKGQPQIMRPSFQIKGIYKWLENYYKDYLCKKGKSDTLIMIAAPRCDVRKDKYNVKDADIIG